MQQVTAAQTIAPPKSPGAPLARYRAKRRSGQTPEPAVAPEAERIFVVQKHAARRLHWDFRLELGGVLVSWAVPKGPSLDPADRRLAVHVEDHPLDYAGFSGTIPKGQYGGGTVEIWDRGTWFPLGDAAAGLRAGELKFVLRGERLRGQFVLVRLRGKPGDKAENWLLLKERDGLERQGADADQLERGGPATDSPADGAERAPMPERLSPQLATASETPPAGEGWLSELKFDGYRLLAWKHGDSVRLVSRNGQDWTARLPSVAAAIAKLPGDLIVDGELVALDADGLSSFARLQAALTRGGDRGLHLYLFDLLYRDGWDLRRCRLLDRKAALARLASWRGVLRYSDHVEGQAARVQDKGCALGLEGTICKRADAPYTEGRSHSWVKLKCLNREEFVILGWTPPAGRRAGLGAVQMGFYDAAGDLHFAGGVGAGLTDETLATLRARLDRLRIEAPPPLKLTGERPDPRIVWVRPELVAELRYAGWSGAGRLRQAIFLGLREDKMAREVVRAVPDEEATREDWAPRAASGAVVVARKPKHGDPASGGVTLTHPDRELWPGITKRDLAEYWRAVAAWALPGIAGRPLAIVRCPDGIGGEHFFQKHGNRALPPGWHEGAADGAPYLALEGEDALVAAAQIAAIELHSWGSSLADPLHPDRLVFDLDPGDGIGVGELVQAARDVRDRLARLGLASYCRSSGGKGLHVVAPLVPAADWTVTRQFCRAFAERMAADAPDRYVAVVRKTARSGRILVDWLRNGLGATAVASYVPRARPGAGVATPLAWREVTAKLDLAAHTIATVPGRLARLRRDPWEGFADAARPLPEEAP